MNTNSTDKPANVAAKFQIFRADGAESLMDSGNMSVEFPSDMRPLVTEASKHGLLDGDQVKVLFDIPGFSLIHAWIKKNYPLSLHTHDTDCLYFIVSGKLRLGNEVLGKGDGFFVPANVPYTYLPVGENGVEILEFRHSGAFNFKSLSKGNFWSKAIETCKSEQQGWQNAISPLARSPKQDNTENLK
ncbi:MAG: mannose-6-phosphate isomerase-like protein (cupin superfamily) [Zhongshania sp.]|jgi:mannose-6-phosphate isomerase-like protein (cupin superfamily)